MWKYKLVISCRFYYVLGIICWNLYFFHVKLLGYMRRWPNHKTHTFHSNRQKAHKENRLSNYLHSNALSECSLPSMQIIIFLPSSVDSAIFVCWARKFLRVSSSVVFVVAYNYQMIDRLTNKIHRQTTESPSFVGVKMNEWANERSIERTDEEMNRLVNELVYGRIIK